MLPGSCWVFRFSGLGLGIWTASTGLVVLEHRFVLKLAGSCSFCGRTGVLMRAIVATSACACRICDECLALCRRIVASAGLPTTRDHLTAPLPDDRGASDLIGQRLQRVLAAIHARRQLQPQHTSAESEALLPAEAADLEQLTRLPDHLAKDVPAVQHEFHCSYCDTPGRQVARLMAGPGVFICDVCAVDVSDVVVHALSW